jgi:hypothetical protein
MRKLLLAVALVWAVAAVTATAALADVTFHAGPSFTDLGGGYTVNLYADVSGLDGTDLVGTIAWSGDVQYTCQNKGGGTAPGQPLHVSTQSSKPVKPNAKNGRAVLDFTERQLDGDRPCGRRPRLGYGDDHLGEPAALHEDDLVGHGVTGTGCRRLSLSVGGHPWPPTHVRPPDVGPPVELTIPCGRRPAAASVRLVWIEASSRPTDSRVNDAECVPRTTLSSAVSGWPAARGSRS